MEKRLLKTRKEDKKGGGGVAGNNTVMECRFLYPYLFVCDL